ncbi:esterase-like activity of phytase family protein [Meiothermus sp. QL-1]|uniref:esterase-like activity of phytase family protein n=1 Tax=Meiothermus sp. QL-1 TaxID=2058095 RepID=UPI000E0C0AEC|nr:esterase-like activity of phytase family protein [Meiothermus sp. QL-1]RDI95181.1 esterase-like activity of phytase family protein [Meiothermus sp. QL-1]
MRRFISLALGAGLALGQGGQVVGVYTLPPTPIRTLNPHLTQADVESSLKAGWPVSDRPALGSSLAYLGQGRFVGSTDRGPNGDCPGGKYFPLPGFTPSLLFFRLEGKEIRLEKSLPLHNLGGRRVSGLPNLPGEDVPFANKECRERLPLDPDGLDVEDIAIAPGGGFWLVEENSPSLLYATPQGAIVMRYVPQGVRLNASYPVRDSLPAILRQRRNNRGLENLALSGDGKTAWIILQSPIGPTSNPAFDQSLVARAVRLDVSNPVQARVTGMYLVPFSDPKDYPKPNRPRDMKYSAATWVKDEQILLLERAEGGARVYLVDFARATNLLSRPDGSSSELDKAGVDYASLGIHLPERRLLLETWRLPEFDTDKLEDLALLEDGQTLAIVDDNDFAITGKEGPSRLWLVRLAQKLR